MTFHAEKTSTTDVIRNWPYAFQEISSGDPLYEYVGAYTTELTAIDDTVEELYNQRFIESATGRELEKIGAEIGITRQSGETDDDFRFRTLLRKVIAASDGTADNIEKVLDVAFGEDALEGISVTAEPSLPVTNFNIPSNYLNDIPMTQTEFEDELERAFPAGHGVNVTEGTVWYLGESGAEGLGQGGLI